MALGCRRHDSPTSAGDTVEAPPTHWPCVEQTLISRWTNVVTKLFFSMQYCRPPQMLSLQPCVTPLTSAMTTAHPPPLSLSFSITTCSFSHLSLLLPPPPIPPLLLLPSLVELSVLAAPSVDAFGMLCTLMIRTSHCRT